MVAPQGPARRHRRTDDAACAMTRRESEIARLWDEEHLSAERIAEVLSLSCDTVRRVLHYLVGPADEPLREPAAARNAGWDFSCDNLLLKR